MKKNILLIEDDFAIIDIYRIVLTSNGFNLETINWGEEALKKIKEMKRGEKAKPDLVLLDLILPDMNGIEILKEIKGQEEIKDLPVFILTNYNNKEIEEEAKKLGVDSFILKTDLTPSDLIKIIKKRFS